MPAVVALGEARRVAGFGLAGATVLVAEDPAQVRAAWAGLPEGTAVVLLTPAAWDALGAERPDEVAPDQPLVAVLPC